ncbi:OmpA family protein [Accumulibacter sp.]|uniref:OmpA family protein n=1 Tax=Accumulibacter sp. TaxID=2053492 RepID=UPI0025DB3773|nr:OmpA family protein [Accumulibacter sp.]MCM8614281.1 OmpA family protein [Accumulibacter sp.]MCM8638077.1 OmpA family protein [Accumulibacter sp.]MCM8641438.1 OmpA family protein [Accumulibacter sp.]
MSRHSILFFVLCSALGLGFSPAVTASGPANDVVELNGQVTAESIEQGLFPKSATASDCAEAAKAGFSCGQIVSRKTYSLPVDVSFAVGSAQISAAAKSLLAQFGPVLKRNEHSGSKVVFVGHTDASGSQQLNQRLSQERAESVRQYFIKDFGVAPSFLAATGVGSAQLKDTNNPNSVVNRRVEITTKPVK